MKVWLALGCLAVGFPNAAGAAQDGAAPLVQFSLERAAPQVSYRFSLREDGTGSYEATYPPTPPATPGETVKVPLTLHVTSAKQVFAQARSTLALHGNCETKARNIAKTGVKTLSYTGPEGNGTCAWNYSDKAAVSALQDEFFAYAETLDQARRLQMEQRFDRLGLDRETAFLVEQVKAGQARGLENIAPLLQAIAEDESLLERVRARAKALLQIAQQAQ